MTVRLLLTVLFVSSCVSPDCTAETKSDLRIVALSPHLAELVFAIGAGDLLIGVSAYTDFPEEATKLPVIGDAFMVDLERLAVLRPNLLLAWKSGTPTHVVDELRSQGYRVEVVTTATLEDIPKALRDIGDYTGHSYQADGAADEFMWGLEKLAAGGADTEPIRVFYQVADRPLYTFNGEHYVSQLIELCGGTNIFGDLGKLAPLIGVEAVLERDPEVMLASSDAGENAFDEWRRWPNLAANRYGNHFLMPAAEIGRATPRVLLAGTAVCEALEAARTNRDTHDE